MSEASESLQIRTDQAESCIAKLREAGLSGFVFRGDRGWLTVVPYADPASDPPLLSQWAGKLAAWLGLPTIAYSCHEDFGWGFLLAMPDGRSTEFECVDGPPGAWAPPDEAGPPPLDEAMLAEVAPVASLRPFLGPPPAVPGEDGPACGFARMLGFPEFRWLSPGYAWQDPDEARKRGGEEIGRRPG